MKKTILLILFNFAFQSIFAQQFYRIKADFSSKEKLPNGSFRLVVGKVYYDKIYQKWIYRVSFPEAQTIILQDTTQYVIGKDGLLKGQSKIFSTNDFSIFHLALSSKMSDFGLGSGKAAEVYKIAKIEKKPNGAIRTTWVVTDKKLAKLMGKIEMENLNKRLEGIAFYDINGKVITNRFFKEYTNVKGVEFPLKDTQISFNSDTTQTIQVTTYKNIVIDQEDENEIYRYKIPITKSAAAKKQPAKSTKQK